MVTVIVADAPCASTTVMNTGVLATTHGAVGARDVPGDKTLRLVSVSSADSRVGLLEYT